MSLFARAVLVLALLSLLFCALSEAKKSSRGGGGGSGGGGGGGGGKSKSKQQAKSGSKKEKSKKEEIPPKASKKKSVKQSQSRTLLLQDPEDGLCLGAGLFKQCGLDTLWYWTGNTASKNFVYVPMPDANSSTSSNTELCMARLDCSTLPSKLEEEGEEAVVTPIKEQVNVGSCKTSCSSKRWNFIAHPSLSAAIVITENDNKNCLHRKGTQPLMVSCNVNYMGLAVHTATKMVMERMASIGTKMIQAAMQNDLDATKAFLTGDASVSINSRDWSDQTALIAAASKGHVEMVRMLITDFHADVNLYNKDKVTAIMEASAGGYQQVVEMLAAAGADVDPQTFSSSSYSSTDSPLWLASSMGHASVVQFLLENNANPNYQQAESGATALMGACKGGHEEAVVLLLEAGADVNIRDQAENSALIHAADNGSVPIVKHLLEKQAETNILNLSSHSPLILASSNGKLEIVEMLVEANALVDLENPLNVTALMYAAAEGHADIVSFLIKKGSDVNKRHSQGGTALFEAATKGSLEVINILLEAHADPLVVDQDRVNVLMTSAAHGHLNITKVLVEKGLPLDDMSDSGGTALMFAASAGHNETVRYLLDKKANMRLGVNATSEYIWQAALDFKEGKEGAEEHKQFVTALMIAAQEGYLSIVKMLVEAGDDLHAADESGQTALSYAAGKTHADVVRYLLEQGASPNAKIFDGKPPPEYNITSDNLLMNAIIANDTELALLAIEKGANLDYADEESITLTIMAAFLGRESIVERLIARGANVRLANEAGTDALLGSASEGHLTIVKMLLEKGKADANVKDVDGTTALMAACLQGHYDVVRLLVLAGADVNAQNVDGHTPLMFAYSGKNQITTLDIKYKEYMKVSKDTHTTSLSNASKAYANIISLLVQKGANPNLPDVKGHHASDFDFYAPVEAASTISP